ncbi:hypothetical protein [Collimonas antrihumi]|uniref:hypothetical protein n=1 Tax=Collimonas antrihumi TaxID=1940615 RepID=UPI001B8AB02A|nr:hypothetical protein [Collimonas antrihumi]
MNSSRKAADPAVAEDYRTPPELLISAVLHLISQYNMHNLASDASVQSARTIERHLRTLSDWPGLAPVLRATCQQLSEQWISMIERALPKQKNDRSALRSTFITRLISGTRAL